MSSTVPRNDRDFDVLLLGILILMSAYFYIQGVSDSIRFLQTWVLSSQKLDALMLEIIVHDTLIEPGGTDGPLFKLTHDTLASLSCDT